MYMCLGQAVCCRLLIIWLLMRDLWANGFDLFVEVSMADVVLSLLSA